MKYLILLLIILSFPYLAHPKKANLLELKHFSQSTIIHRGDSKNYQVSDQSHVFVNGIHYLVWSMGSNARHGPTTGGGYHVFISRSNDGIHWQTDTTIKRTNLGTFNHTLAVDYNGNIHIVCNQRKKVSKYGAEITAMVHLTNAPGFWKKVSLNELKQYRYFAPQALFFTSDGILNLVFNRDGWYRDNAPLYEQLYISGRWRRVKMISNYSFGSKDPDDFENVFCGWDIINGQKCYFLSGGFYHRYYHGPILYSNKVFKLVKSPGTSTGYYSEELSYNHPKYTYHKGNFAFISADFRSVYLNNSLVYSASDLAIQFTDIHYDRDKNIIVVNGQKSSRSTTWIFQDEELVDTVSHGAGYLANGLFIFNKNEQYSTYLAVNRLDPRPDNVPPVINPGPSITMLSKEIKTNVIKGTAKDLDQYDRLEYRWFFENNANATYWEEVSPDGVCTLSLAEFYLPPGGYTLFLEVNDGIHTVRKPTKLFIQNSPPDFLVDHYYKCDVDSDFVITAMVSDFDGDMITYSWSDTEEVLDDGSLYTYAQGDTVELPDFCPTDLLPGNHLFTLHIKDEFHEPMPRDVVVEIFDTLNPTLELDIQDTILYFTRDLVTDLIVTTNPFDNSGVVHLSTSVSPSIGINKNEVLLLTDSIYGWTDPEIDQASGIIYLTIPTSTSLETDEIKYKVTVTAKDHVGNLTSSSILVRVTKKPDEN